MPARRKDNPATVRGLCVTCGKNLQKTKGGGRWSAQCSPCIRRRYPKTANRDHKARELRKRPWLRHRGDHCERCGFVPEHICQLDVDHKDGDRSNGSPENLQTLCANCHRLKTFQSRDWEDKVQEPQRALLC